MSIQNNEIREQRDYKNVKPKQNKRVRLTIEWGKNTFIYIVEYIKIQNTINQRVTTNCIEKNMQNGRTNTRFKQRKTAILSDFIELNRK